MINVSGLSKSFGIFSVVKDLNFNIKKGEIVGLLGPNGAGKTTTMRMLTGYYKPTKGNIEIGGRDIKSKRIEIQKQIGYLPESASSYAEMSVQEFLHFIAAARGISDAQTKSGIEFAVDSTSLHSYYYRPISQLSKGYRQRVGLAAALIHNPEILILDEPTSGLDPNQILEIQNLILRLAKEKTIILSTHILKEVEAICQRVLIISDGKLVLDKELSALQGQSDSYTLHIRFDKSGLSKEIETVLAASPITEKTEGAETIYTLQTSDDQAPAKIFRAAAEKGWLMTELYKEKKSLEDVFRNLTINLGDNK